MCWRPAAAGPRCTPDTPQIKLQSPLDQRQEHLRIPAVGVSGSVLSAQPIGPADCRQVPWALCQLLVLALRMLPANKPYQADSDYTMVLTPGRETASYIHPPRTVSMETYCSSFLRKDCPPYWALNTPSLQPPQGLCTSCFFCSIALSPGIHMDGSFRFSTNCHLITKSFLNYPISICYPTPYSPFPSLIYYSPRHLVPSVLFVYSLYPHSMRAGILSVLFTALGKKDEMKGPHRSSLPSLCCVHKAVKPREVRGLFQNHTAIKRKGISPS